MSPDFDRLTVTRHGNSQVHIELQFSRELRVGGEPELVAGVEEVVELHVEQSSEQILIIPFRFIFLGRWKSSNQESFVTKMKCHLQQNAWHINKQGY